MNPQVRAHEAIKAAVVLLKMATETTEDVAFGDPSMSRIATAHKETQIAERIFRL